MFDKISNSVFTYFSEKLSESHTKFSWTKAYSSRFGGSLVWFERWFRFDLVEIQFDLKNTKLA